MVFGVDNFTVVCALAGAISVSGDLQVLVTLVHGLCAKHKVRWWVEWVPSHSNPADGLSRYGAADELAVLQGWPVHELLVPTPLEKVGFDYYSLLRALA